MFFLYTESNLPCMITREVGQSAKAADCYLKHVRSLGEAAEVCVCVCFACCILSTACFHVHQLRAVVVHSLMESFHHITDFVFCLCIIYLP